MAEIILTDQQKEVVNNRGGTLLVSAAAGSGKTKVLVDRVLKRVEEDGCDLDQFLMITFTQAAASELRGKLIAQLSERLAAHPQNRHLQRQLGRVYLAQISTVHAFCAGLLREYAHALELAPDFRVCDEQEATVLRQRAMDSVLEEAYAGVGADSEIAAALNTFGGGRNDTALPELIGRVHASVQCYSRPAQRLQELRDGLQLSGITDVGQTVWGEYLLEAFRLNLQQWIAAMEETMALLSGQESLSPYLPTFSDNLALLRQLAQQRGWDELRAVPLDFGRLKPIRSCPVPEVQEKVKAVRKRVLDELRAARERLTPASDEALEDLQRNSEALGGLLTLTARFDAAYAAEKKNRRAVDYNDLEHRTLELLLRRDGTPTAAAREIGGRFVELMVDEYQDTNAVQDAIFGALSDGGRNLFFVGDVKQSIYRFRLADPKIFLDKYQRFADYTEAQEGQPRRVLLSDNFRSHGEILAAANDVFRLTMTPRVGGLRYGDDEALRDGLQMKPTGTPMVELHCVSMDDVPKQPPHPRAEIEAEFVAARIARMLRDGETIPEGKGQRPIRPEDIVILLHALRGKAELYIRALSARGIRCVSGNENIFDTEEILLLHALLQIIDNPHQDIPLLAVLMSPLLRVSPDALAEARAQTREGDLFTALCRHPAFQDFSDTLDAFRALAQRSSLRELLDSLDERLFLRAIFGAMEGGAQRVKNLERFFALADAYESGERFGLHGFLSYVEALKEKGVATDDAPAAGAVRIMTIHKSKGLEFPVVFLADLCKRFNQEDAAAPLLVDPVLGLGASGYDPAQRISYPTVARVAISRRIRQENISEEMRVLYVAMTRPKYRLIMTCCDKNLRGKLQTIARELTLPASDALIESAGSQAHWVLMTAMARTEAGELFAVGGAPEERRVSQHPWKITWNEGRDFLPEPTQESEKPEMEQRPEKLAFQPIAPLHPEAQRTPSKLTATQLKGRTLDDEVSDGTVQPFVPHFPRPQFTAQRSLTPAERGTAIHLAMQYLSYEACTGLDAIERELDRLVEKKFLTPQQRQAVPAQKLLRFFTSALGQRVLHAPRLVREFKFSVFEDGAVLSPALAGEEILLQGVTDCALVEPDGLVILDFKSDHLRRGEEAQRAQYYRGQLDAYSRALSRVFSCPVKERVLYFFATDTAVFV